MHWVPDDEDYEAVLDASYVCNGEVRKEKGVMNGSLMVKMLANKEVVDRVTEAKDGREEELMVAARELAKLRREEGIVDEDLYVNPTSKAIALKVVYLLLGLPYFLFAFATNFQTYVISELLCRTTDEKAFNNTFRFPTLMAMLPVSVAVVATLGFIYLPWYWALGLVLLTIPGFAYAHDWLWGVRHLVSQVKALKNVRYQELRKKIIKEYKSL